MVTCTRCGDFVKGDVAMENAGQMILGLLLMAVGIAITYATYNAASEQGEGYYVVCLAPVLCGLGLFFVGLRGWLENRGLLSTGVRRHEGARRLLKLVFFLGLIALCYALFVTVTKNWGERDASPEATTTRVATPSLNGTSDTSDCTLNATFVTDITVPDDTRIEPGQAFTKTWRIRNTGTCEWGVGYRLIFGEGDHMGGPDSVGIPETGPGESADVSVELIAPPDEGQYRGYWQICVTHTECFGDRVYVQIVSSRPPVATPSLETAP
jgi:hypothetical protein